MREITSAAQIADKKNIAMIDTSSVSFLQKLRQEEIPIGELLEDYDLILIPKWVINEINDSTGRIKFIEELIKEGYPIYVICEERYSLLVDCEEYNLFQVVMASVAQMSRIRSYLRRFVEKADSLDMEPYEEWIEKLYEEWPISGDVLGSGRVKKKNAGEVSLTILTEVVSWYYPDIDDLTVYSQDRDTYEYQHKAEMILMDVFSKRYPVPVSFKSNDAILCQLFRTDIIDMETVKSMRKDIRKLTYSIDRADNSVAFITEEVDNERFVKLIQNTNIKIVF